MNNLLYNTTTNLYPNSKSGYFYIIYNISYSKFNFINPFKIGRSNNPKKRLNQLSTGQIYNSKLIYISELCYDYIIADSLLKQHLRKYKINRELYDIPLNDAINLINHVVYDVNNPIDCRTFI